MPKFTKGHYLYPEATGPSNFFLLTTNLFIKLEALAPIVFEIFCLKGTKCPNLQRVITPEMFFGISSKVKSGHLLVIINQFIEVSRLSLQ